MTANISYGHARAERRRYPRLPIHIHVNFQPLSQPAAPGETESRSENLSLGGVAVNTVHALPIGQVVRIMLHIPARELLREKERLTRPQGEEIIGILVEGRVAWCASSGSTYRIGLEFMNMEPDDRECLRRFLEEFVFVEDESRE